MPPTHPDRILAKGRGATLNEASARFSHEAREADGDWLDTRDSIDGDGPRLRTEVAIEHPKTILNFNASPDVPFDRSVNAYRGCEHGCIYCYARPTHAYLGLSPGLDFETRLSAKPEAAELLRKTWSKPGYSPALLAIGTNTDPYQPIEARFGITRQILELCLETRHPIVITTKSDRVTRDIDLLAKLAEQRLTAVAISVTSMDGALARTIEPRAPQPRKRLAAIRALSKAGVPTHISISPVIPAITDHEMESLVAAGAEAGAVSASYIPVRLPNEVAPIFRDWLDAHFPERAAKVMHIIQQMRGGRDNDPRFHERMRAEGPWADLLRARFKRLLKKHGLNQRRITPRADLFVPPRSDTRQGELFG